MLFEWQCRLLCGLYLHQKESPRDDQCCHIQELLVGKAVFRQESSKLRTKTFELHMLCLLHKSLNRRHHAQAYSKF